MGRPVASAVVHGDQVAGGNRLAGEDEVVGFLFRFEGAAAELVDGADDEFGHAGSASAFLAGEWRFDAGITGRGEQGLVGGDCDLMSFAAQPDVQSGIDADQRAVGGG